MNGINNPIKSQRLSDSTLCYLQETKYKGTDRLKEEGWKKIQELTMLTSDKVYLLNLFLL